MTPFVQTDYKHETKYKLTAVLMHTGTSANSGHYTARILDQATTNGDSPSWLSFNDELVTFEEWNATTSVGNVTLLEKTTMDGGRLFSSKTAYMLTYTRVSDLGQTTPPAVPQGIRSKVAATDAEAQAAIDTYRQAIDEREKAIRERETLQAEVTQVWNASMDAAGAADERWISTAWLTRWLTELPKDVGLIDNTLLLSAHGQANPAKVGSMKLISKQAFEILQRRFGGGPALAGRGCEESCRMLQAGEALEAALGQPSGATDGEVALFVDKSVAKKWRKWLEAGATDANAEIRCAQVGAASGAR